MVTKTAPKKKVQKNPERSKKDAFDILDERIKIYRTASKVWQMQTWIKEVDFTRFTRQVSASEL